MKFLVVIVGLFAIGNAAIVRLADSTLLPTVVSPIVPSIVPGIVPGVIPSVVPTIPATVLSEWEAYKTKFGKTYHGIEDRFRRNIYFANKEKVAKYDELIRFGIAVEKLELDIFADYTRDELFTLRSILEESQDEWNTYKLKYGKVYESFEDRFRKTVYFIVKDLYEAQNKLADHGIVSFRVPVSFYSDFFFDELASGTHLLPVNAIVPTHHVLPATRLYTSYELTYPPTGSFYRYFY